MSEKYSVIYADPPWRYDFSKDNTDAIESKYPTMSVEEICALQVPSEDNAVLYLWATAPKLREALEVMKAWGFIYRTCAVWDKKSIGMGYWFRTQHELLLVGVRGKFSPPLPEKRVSSILKEKRGEHSAKPDYVKFLITDWYPEETKLELFSRGNKSNLFQKNNWDVWGNEVKTNINITT